MWKLGLSAIVLGLLAATAGSHSAAAAERRCEFRFDHEKPAWVAEMQPRVRQGLASVIGHLMVLEQAKTDRAMRATFNCGCYMDHVDWEAVRAEFPNWYRTEPIASGKLAREYRRLSDNLREIKSAFRRQHCL